MHGLEAEFWGRIDFVYLDIDNPENRGTMQKYGFTAQPLFVLVMPDGTAVKKLFGYHTQDELRSTLDELLTASGG